ncbi:class I SAM-dependent methyltransferase [Dactylosporangium sp. CA-139066]|uniref:class I SAM-dependent methyltransferase n=1 Tax=Dactylosporangium sp. CA-139066 TaxID=3239930 RepID=UPI003D93C709
MGDENAWLRRRAEDPEHLPRYVQRFRDLAASGADLAGEARLIDAMVPRAARILDAGSGTGRVGAFLHAAGHEVVGVDLDPDLVAVAEHDHPGPTWLTGDLAHLDLPAAGVKADFDVVFCAGNVMTFVAPSTRVEVLRRLAAHTAEHGRVVVGFGAGRGYEFDEFLADAATAGLRPDVLLSTWDLRPFAPSSDFLVAVLVSNIAGASGAEDLR